LNPPFLRASEKPEKNNALTAKRVFEFRVEIQNNERQICKTRAVLAYQGIPSAQKDLWLKLP
jgi:hypothetical protein